MRSRRPLIGVISDRRVLGHHPFHLVGEKYLDAVLHGAGGFPVSLPVLAGDFDIREALEHLDGLLLTGSPSNVEPWRYQGTASSPGTLNDAERDAAALALIPAAVAAGLPLMAICRGFQEMNVAFGGTLHQAVHELPGFGNHREDGSQPIEQQYAPSHEVSFTPGGILERISGQTRAKVNSVHSQGVDQLAAALVVEAVAPDGLIEAFTVRDAPGFTLAVQWHPEWRVQEHTLSMALFRAFGDAVGRYRTARGSCAQQTRLA